MRRSVVERSIFANKSVLAIKMCKRVLPPLNMHYFLTYAMPFIIPYLSDNMVKKRVNRQHVCFLRFASLGWPFVSSVTVNLKHYSLLAIFLFCHISLSLSHTKCADKIIQDTILLMSWRREDTRAQLGGTGSGACFTIAMNFSFFMIDLLWTSKYFLQKCCQKLPCISVPEFS